MSELALFRLPDGTAWLAHGPFQSSATPPDSGGAFYINDFALSDPTPWKIPQKLELVGEKDLAEFKEIPPPQITWQKPTTEWFKMAFRRIRRDILSGKLEKMVPALTECGTLRSGQMKALLARILEAPSNTWAYAWISPKCGFCGATPELLFHREGASLATMALAGTAKPGNRDAFLTDLKEISEHEFVVSDLLEVLSSIGNVERQPRELCTAGSLLHFQTHLTATIPVETEDDFLLKKLHPTPAVGYLPRAQQWLERLLEYRSMLKVPPFFGSPFGFIEPGASRTHFVVSIRGLAWQGDKVCLPSGCGIVAGSAFDHEWRELRLKREAVASQLGI